MVDAARRAVVAAAVLCAETQESSSSRINATADRKWSGQIVERLEHILNAGATGM